MRNMLQTYIHPRNARAHLCIYLLIFFFSHTDVRGLVNKKHVQEGHEQVQQALMDYTISCYPSVPVFYYEISLKIQ